VNDLLGQQIPFMFSNASVVLSNVKAGKLRGLAVTTAKRTSFAPEIPTIAETLPGFEAATWFALVAPAGTPRDIVQKLNAEIQRIAALPETQQRFADLVMTSEASTPEALDATIKSEIAKWAKVIKDADIKPAD
jgi:tripartite-type tricarboxylate transporter receptor subunit TctC